MQIRISEIDSIRPRRETQYAPDALFGEVNTDYLQLDCHMEKHEMEMAILTFKKQFDPAEWVELLDRLTSAEEFPHPANPE